MEMAIDKAGNTKNINKPHPDTLDIEYLQILLEAEVSELKAEIYRGDKEGILNECKDIINFALFMAGKCV